MLADEMVLPRLGTCLFRFVEENGSFSVSRLSRVIRANFYIK